jgi:AraC-binding-like domain
MSLNVQPDAASAPQNAPDRFMFSTDTLPERDRFVAYRDGLFLQHMHVDVHTRGDGAFRAKIDLADAGGIKFGAMSSSPTLYERKGHLLSDGDDGAVVYLGRSGRLVTRQGAVDCDYGRGSGIIIRSGAESATEVLSGAEVWTISVPDHVLKGFMRPGRAIEPCALEAGAASTQLLISYLAALWDVRDTAGTELRKVTSAHVADLVAHALGVGGEAEQIALGRGVKAGAGGDAGH